MATKKGVTDIDKGARRLLALVKGVNAQVLMVGVFGDKAAEKANGDTGLTVGEVAAAHEFAVPAGQPRTWLRSTLDVEAPAIVRGLGKLYKEVLGGLMQPEGALKLTGLAIVGKIQARMAGGIPPKLNPEYEKRKLQLYPGQTTPLIASNQFRGSIASAVVNAAEVK